MSDILIGKGELPVHLKGHYGNRHGLIAGATGSGKTASLLVLAEGFSRMGVPVFMADVKGDAAGLATPGVSDENIAVRVSETGLEGYANEASPVVFWDIYGKFGHPMRTTISEVGPGLLAHMLELNDIQAGVLEVAFTLADDEGLLLLDMDDLRAVLEFVAENRQEISVHYGAVNAQSIAAIQRALLRFESGGDEQLFGEPALELADLMRTDRTGRGIINILAADQLALKPRLYSGFLLWLLSELFEALPEVGDLDKPSLVLFFDEAHLLFDAMPPTLRERVDQVVRLIRTKGVGVYFCSQFPDDMPREILGQLGNRVQHALQTFSPRDHKAVKAAAEILAANPRFDVANVISQLGVGEALVSTLAEKGIPQPVERTLVCPPRCRVGSLSDEERAAVRMRSPVGTKYDMAINRESAYEVLNHRAAEKVETLSVPAARKAARSAQASSPGERLCEVLRNSEHRQGMTESVVKSAVRSAGSQPGRQILRGLLGSIMGGSGHR